MRRQSSEGTITKGKARLHNLLRTGVIAITLILSAGIVGAAEAPTNAELYKMILELKAEQKKLQAEAVEAKAEAAAAKEALADARSELEDMRQQATLQAKVDVSPEAYAPSSFESEEPLVRVELDALDWKLRNTKHEYGITDIGGVQDRGAVGKILSIDPESEHGARLTISGRPFGRDNPLVSYTYTDFDAEANEQYTGPLRATFVSSDNSENDDSDNINTLGVETITPDDRATRAVASYDFDYKVHDLVVGKTIAESEVFALKLSGGVRYVDMDHDFRVTYTGGDFQTAFTAFETSSVQGGGPLLGADLNWKIIPSLAAQFGVKGGMVLGDVETRTFIPDDEPGVPTNVRYDDTRAIPFVETGASLNYSRSLGELVFNASIGYEMINWFDATDSRMFSDSHIEGQNVHQTGDLSLDGAYIRIGIGY